MQVTDSNITILPSELLTEVQGRIAGYIPTEQTRAVQYLRAYSELFYAGELPADFQESIRTMEALWQGK